MNRVIEHCPGCAAELPRVDGPTDPYGGATASCWAVFGEVCMKDFGEYRYPDVHRLIVDAYMAQHPGLATPAGRRSLATHLVGLYCSLARGMSAKEIVRVLAKVFPDKQDLPPFAPIPSLGGQTVATVRDAANLTEHQERATAWAHAVWQAWSPHHHRVEALFSAATRGRAATTK